MGTDQVGAGQRERGEGFRLVVEEVGARQVAVQVSGQEASRTAGVATAGSALVPKAAGST